MFGLRMPELLIILLVLVLVFGANKIPQLGSALGDTMKNFKKALNAKDEAAAAQDPARKVDAAAGAPRTGDEAKVPADRQA
jgi:sec-independent protein translocase protein TatA